MTQMMIQIMQTVGILAALVAMAAVLLGIGGWVCGLLADRFVESIRPDINAFVHVLAEKFNDKE